jgi:hypothetical protein
MVVNKYNLEVFQRHSSLFISIKQREEKKIYGDSLLQVTETTRNKSE